MKQTDVKTIGVLLLAALLVTWGLVTPAAALEAKLSGQVNQLVTIIDDGDEQDTFVADNDNSSTRFRFTGEEALGSVTAGFVMEFEAQRNASNKLQIDNDNPTDEAGDFEVAERHLDAYLKTNFGKVSLGLGSGAADGTAECDLSGTTLVIKSDAAPTVGSIRWKDENGNTIGGDDPINVGDTRDNLNGLGRNQRLRYDTPDFAGFSVAASSTNGDAYEVALWYAADIGGKLAAALGYVDSGDIEGDDDYTQISASISWLAPFGLNVSLAYGTRSYEDDSVYSGTTIEREDVTHLYGKIGYKFGIHAVAVDYGVNNDLLFEEVSSSNYSVGYVVKPWNPVELYAAYRIYMLDVDEDYYPDDIENITQMLAGMRIKF